MDRRGDKFLYAVVSIAEKTRARRPCYTCHDEIHPLIDVLMAPVNPSTHFPS